MGALSSSSFRPRLVQYDLHRRAFTTLYPNQKSSIFLLLEGAETDQLLALTELNFLLFFSMVVLA